MEYDSITDSLNLVIYVKFEFVKPVVQLVTEVLQLPTPFTPGLKDLRKSINIE